MALYDGETPENLQLAIDSMLAQTLQADEIIVVNDGTLTPELDSVLSDYKAINSSITIIENDTKIGVAAAWNAGVQHAQTAYVARMDSDDICVPERLEIQKSFIDENPEVDVLGGYISEFNNVEDAGNVDCMVRQVPLSTDQIAEALTTRNPMNHVTVVFKKSVWEKVGGYEFVKNHVDWWFWARLLNNSAVFRNIPKILVYVRQDDRQIRRRGGFEYFLTEIHFNNLLRKQNGLSIFKVFKNLAIRLPFRVMPFQLRSRLYKLIR